jgi:hypothetical protein
MLINPPRLDKPFLILTKVNNATLYYTFTSNKNIKDCEILRGDFFSCEVISNTSVRMSLQINDTNFLDKIFNGELSITSDAPQDTLEVARISLTARVYNLNSPILGIPALWVGIILLIALIMFSIFFVLRSRINNKSRKQL